MTTSVSPELLEISSEGFAALLSLREPKTLTDILRDSPDDISTAPSLLSTLADLVETGALALRDGRFSRTPGPGTEEGRALASDIAGS